MEKLFYKFLLITVWLFSAFTLSGQEINWSNAPRKGFVYQINNKEARKLLTKSTPDSIFKKLLHTRIDSFDVRQGWINRPSKGHFILTRVIGNKLQCEYTCVFPYQVFLLKEYDALSIQVLDLNGTVRDDAKVKLGFQRLRIDSESKTYRVQNDWFYGDHQTVTVELDGFLSAFNVTKNEVPWWNRNYNEDDGPDFYSYMITDKNKYKPNENIRFKSYALSGSKSPLRKELELYLTGNQKYVKVCTVNPHRPGSYAGEFKLHDSLSLVLDKVYQLQLREKGGRIVSNCSFRYEDYELSGNKLDVKLATSRQFNPDNNEITITATDVNGLLLKDAKATVLIKTQSIGETFDPVIILPDTLLFTSLDMNPEKPTTLTVPSQLFQKANTSYEIIVTVLNSQNQRMERRVYGDFIFSRYELTSRFSNDSICFDILYNDVPMENIPVTLCHDGELAGQKVYLPYMEKINPSVKSIYIENEFVSRHLFMNSLNPKLELKGGILKDSFNVELFNPQNLEISWYIYQGSNLLEKGFGKVLAYNSLIGDRTQTYYVELLYSYGGEEHLIKKQFEFREESLDVSLNIPERVYPGQTVEASILVRNQLGQPMRNVDLTAFAATAKLDYYVPDLPYYGSHSSPRSQKATYNKKDLNSRTAILDLDYPKWEKTLRLDTMKYYQFTYPGSDMFKHTVDIADSTQFAVYVMQKGIAKQIYVIEVNRQPVYYSWVDQPKAYSFYVSPVGRKEISLRLFDKVLVLDSLSFEECKKTILSLDLDHLPQGTKILKLKNKFTSTEINRHLNYVSAFKRTYNDGYLISKTEFVPLNSTYRDILVGPVIPERKTFHQKYGYYNITYNHTGGFSYEFEDNIVYKLNASNLIPEFLSNTAFDPMSTINQKVITKLAFLQEPPSNFYRWNTTAIDIINPESRLKILLPAEKDKSGVNAVLFQDSKTKYLVNSYEDNCNENRSKFYSLPKGLNNIIVIYNNGKYLKMDSIYLKTHINAVINLKQATHLLADTFSQGWLLSHPFSSRKINNSRTEVASQIRTYSYDWSSDGNVKGIITDETGEPIPGVCVVVRGTTIGTVSDMDGNFSIRIDDTNAILVFSFVGYVTEEVNVTTGSAVSLTMTPEIMQLSEVVVVGYGTQRKSDLTGAVSVINAESLSAPDEKPVIPENKQTVQDAEQKLYQELLNLKSIRSNFSDIGFWEPRLFTDKKGESKFKVTFPDDITRWNAVVYAMNRQLQTGTARKSIKSYKPLMAELHVPQFLTRGDSAFFLGKVLNYTNDSTILGSVKWEGANTDFEKQIQFNSFHKDKLPVNASNTDSITTQYVFTREDGYMDGEKRTIPVIEQGVIRADGSLSFLKNGDDKSLKAPQNGTLHVEIMDNQLDIYAQEVYYLLNYRYACNEQLASKLIGLINHKMWMQYESKPFKYDNDVYKIIGRLLKNQNQEFLWSWWNVSSTTSNWMSAHILRSLKYAKDAGYQVNLDIENIARKAEYKFSFLKNFGIWDTDLLNALASWNAKMDYPKYVQIMDSIILEQERLEEVWYQSSRYRYSYLKEKLLLQEVRQLAGLPIQRDSILKYKKEGIMGDIYFSDNKTSYYWYNDRTAANLIVYRIVKNDSILRDLSIPMQMYFLASRKEGSWNTYQSSNALMSILPDLLAEGLRKNQTATVILSGKEQKTITRFPYRAELQPGEVLHMHKESGIPLYYMQYVEERVTEAKTGVPGFEINTSFGKDSLQWEAGEPVTLKVEVKVTKDASLENVMIEVPIPAACSYADRRPVYNGIETHREYFKDRTVIFCENMKPGKYLFAIHLLPRFTGKYLINPAQVSLMYVPVVNANTEMKRIKVWEPSK